MCRSRRDAMGFSPKSRRPPSTTRRSSHRSGESNQTAVPSDAGSHKSSRKHTSSTPAAAEATPSSRCSRSGSAGSTTTTTTNGGVATTTNSSSSVSSRASLSSLHDTLADGPTLFPFHELSAATAHFLSGKLSSSSWRCSLRGRDAVVVRRPFLGDPSVDFPSRLSAVCRSHHASLVPLLGASLPSSGDGSNLYLVYDYAAGASLSECLRNPKNPGFTVLSTWSSRVKVAADLAQGLEYIHRHRGTVHNRIKSSAIVVAEPHLRAKICYFGAAELSGELAGADEDIRSDRIGRADSRRMRVEGTRGYMAPEVIAGGKPSRESDVYAFGVVLLELIAGEEPVRYRYRRESGEVEMASLVESAREAVGGRSDDDDERMPEEEERRRVRVRAWVDWRLKDSFPVGAAVRLARVALRCVSEVPAARPGMEWVAGKVSKSLVESRAWGERFKVPADITVSVAPR